MPARKRTRAEMEASEPAADKKEPSLLQRIRDMWEFSAVMQYIYMFGKVIKIDEDFDVEDFEEECLKPSHSEKLEEIGLTLLKWISSHRGLTYEIWDEYVRRQYQAKAPHLPNPYGDEAEPKKFRNFDIFQKIRILHQLTVWTFWNSDRIREKMPEHQKESEQVEWRMEPFGWDSEEREYYVLDDNRMYRRTEPPLPVVPKAKPKANTLKARAARRRASKRRKVEQDDFESEDHEEDDTSQLDVTQVEEQDSSDTYGGYKWECVAISLDDFNQFLESIKKTKDPNEKELRKRIVEDVLPVIEAAAEKQRRKQERRERELMLMEKMAGAKRSSRLADKQERERKERDEAEAAHKKAIDLAAAHREQEKHEKMEEDRRSRMMTREQRIKDREYKRLLMEEELERDIEEQKRIEEGEKRGSERHLKERMEKNKKELEDLDSEEEDWTFDCSGCGKHGKNYDDGSHIIACERCNVWQHSKCLGIAKSAAEKDDFHFVCNDCRKKEEEAKRPKIMLKFATGPSSSPPQQPVSPVEQQQPARLVSVDIPKNATDTVQVSSSNGVHVAQSSHSRQNFASPRSQIQSGNIDRHAHSPSPQQPRQMPILGPSSPSLQTTNPVWTQRPPHQHTPNGNSVSQYPGSNSAFANSFGRQNQTYPNQSLFASAQSTPRPPPAQGASSGASTVPRRIPSPVINRPTMSPTQGNPDVGPIAGVPGSSPSSYHPALFTPNANGNLSRPGSQEQQINGYQSHRSSSSPYQSFASQTPNPQHLSGLSPVKQRVTSPLPPPSNIPQKNSNGSSPPTISSSANSSHINNSTLRSVSGTPIFPPAERLAPSPEMMNREPVPTPSKQPSPPMVGVDSRRSSGIADLMQGVQTNGNVTEQQAVQLQSLPPAQPALQKHDQTRQS